VTAPEAEGSGAQERRTALREEYVSRVNQVIDYIDQHLGDELNLTVLAGVANFSPFHFHRVFTSVMGETPRRFLHRVRLERAAGELLLHPRTPVTRIAEQCGFSGSAPFARSFQEAFGMSASAWRAGGHRLWRSPQGRAEPVRSVAEPRFRVLAEGLDERSRAPYWRLGFPGGDPVLVTLEKVPERRIAYLRHVGRYQGDGELFARLFGELRRWAAPRGLLADGSGSWICVYHDPDGVTADDKLRVTAGLTVPGTTAAGGRISTMTVAGGLYAVGTFRLRDTGYTDAWEAMMTGWLPESGCALDDRHCFERFPLVGGRSEDGSTLVDICLPVTPD
jgi:AraC family transcriptional regulator